MSANITVIDGVMGAGKTTHMIAKMNKHTEQKYLFVTPYLDEVSRIKRDCCSRNFKEPSDSVVSKSSDLKRLVEQGENIVATHSLIAHFDTELQGLLRNQEYTLVVDETLETTTIQSVSRIARELLTISGCVSISETTARVKWHHFLFPSAKGNKEFERIKRMCDNETLYWVPNDNSKGDGFIAWHFPPSAFHCFHEVFILTYQFQGSLMDSYMKLNGLEYSIDTRFANLDRENRAKFKDRIEFLEESPKWAKDLGENGLSSSWIKNEMDANAVRASLKTICNKHGFKTRELMWTTLKEAAPRLTNSKSILRIAKKDASEAQKRKSNFVSCNERATNRYGNRSVLFYIYNRFPPLDIEQYFLKRGLVVDRDKFALNEMLQWIFRSRIRNDEPIKLFLPSPRMRRLLEDWLEGKDLEEHETTSLAA